MRLVRASRPFVIGFFTFILERNTLAAVALEFVSRTRFVCCRNTHKIIYYFHNYCFESGRVERFFFSGLRNSFSGKGSAVFSGSGEPRTFGHFSGTKHNNSYELEYRNVLKFNGSPSLPVFFFLLPRDAHSS